MSLRVVKVVEKNILKWAGSQCIVFVGGIMMTLLLLLQFIWMIWFLEYLILLEWMCCGMLLIHVISLPVNIYSCVIPSSIFHLLSSSCDSETLSITHKFCHIQSVLSGWQDEPSWDQPESKRSREGYRDRNTETDINLSATFPYI